jgi:exosortase O
MKGLPASPFGVTSWWTTAWHSNAARGVNAAWNLALLALWVKFFWPVFQYLAVLFTDEAFRTNQILLFAVAALLFLQARNTRLHLRLDSAPRLYWPALSMALGAALAYLLVERYLDINTLSAFLFGLASYGLLGLWLEPTRWRRGFLAVLLVVGVLPFGDHLETFVGYPVRTVTAGLVRDGFAALGIHSVGVDTILVFESGVSQVDIPCSGMKSLWTGALFLLAATWIKSIPLSLRWLLVVVLTALLLLSANLIRVAALALTGPVLGWTQLAQMLHVPLGVLGFVATCAAAVFLLDRLPAWPSDSQPSGPAIALRQMPQPRWLSPLLALTLLTLVLLYVPRAAISSAPAFSQPVWRFPDGLQLQSAPLSKQEQEWIRQGGAEKADRFTFQWQGAGQPVSGTLLLLSSQTWRGQHRPERCFEVFGLTVRESTTFLVSPGFPLRYLSLSGAAVPGQTSAAYWLQSANQTTEDFGKRIWADLRPERETWVLVTVLFDQQYDARRPELADLLTAMHASIASSLTERGEP